jgi:hypothetical protein
VLPYSDAVSEHRDLLTRRIRALVDRGLAAFYGHANDRWRYTARGAVLATATSYWRGVSQGLRPKKGTVELP